MSLILRLVFNHVLLWFAAVVFATDVVVKTINKIFGHHKRVKHTLLLEMVFVACIFDLRPRRCLVLFMSTIGQLCLIPEDRHVMPRWHLVLRVMPI